jgi:hypothetical protein
MENQPAAQQPRPTYRWPRFVLAAFILAVVLAVIWMSYAVKRTRALRELNSPSSTNGTMF